MGLDQEVSSVNTNVELSSLNWNNLGIINCIEILATKSNNMGLKPLWTKFQLSPPKYKRKHSFLVVSLDVKRGQLWCQIFLLL